MKFAGNSGVLVIAKVQVVFLVGGYGTSGRVSDEVEN